MLVFSVSLNCTIFSDFISLFPQYLYFQFIIFLGSNSKIFENLSWHKYDELKMEMESLVQKYNDLLSMYTLSETSVEGRPLLVMKISTDKNNQRAELKPMVKYVANMHGNEPTGREITLAFIEYLAETYVAGTVSTNIFNILTYTDRAHSVATTF